MAEEVKLPALGESVEEGVITAWLVEVGDDVDVDQPLVEISTDKVDTEVPSPVAGTVQELRAEVDDTIEVGQTIAVVGEGPVEDGAAEDQDGGEEAEAAEEAEEAATEEEEGAGDDAEDGAEQEATEQATAAAAPEQTSQAAEDRSGASGGEAGGGEADHAGGASAATPAQPRTPAGDGNGGGAKALTSPLVRKMLREAEISPDQVEGTGQGGRITREDAERAIEQGVEAPAEEPAAEEPEAKEPAAAPASERQQRPAREPASSEASSPPPSAPSPAGRPDPSPQQVDFGGEQQVTEDLSRVRKAIAKAMYNSMQSTAQLTAAVEVDMTPIMALRARMKDAFKQQHGASLSPLPIVARAVCMTLPRHPHVNASIDLDGGTATYHNYINLGMAVDTERGLLVPNIKHAEDLNIPGLAKRIVDIAGKARSGKGLSPDDIQGGTFTITNTGSRGTLWDTPILNPPEVAILATCAIEKRAVVMSDAMGDSIAIRHMMYLCLTYDHRMIDGADAARFLQDLKWVTEHHDFAGELNL